MKTRLATLTGEVDLMEHDYGTAIKHHNELVDRLAAVTAERDELAQGREVPSRHEELDLG